MRISLKFFLFKINIAPECTDDFVPTGFVVLKNDSIGNILIWTNKEHGTTSRKK